MVLRPLSKSTLISFCVSQTVSSATRTSMPSSPACRVNMRNSAVLLRMRSGLSLLMSSASVPFELLRNSQQLQSCLRLPVTSRQTDATHRQTLPLEWPGSAAGSPRASDPPAPPRHLPPSPRGNRSAAEIAEGKGPGLGCEHSESAPRTIRGPRLRRWIR
jgi:hypothetical protein